MQKMIRKARKEHKCRWSISPDCTKTIRKGEEYMPLRIPKECLEYGDGVCLPCLTFKKFGCDRGK